MDDLRGRDFIESSGVFGPIIKIDANKIIIRGKDNVEKIVVVDNNTVIRRFQDTLKISDLKVDDPIVIIGNPDGAGQIMAKLIRVMPPMPAGSPAPNNASSTSLLPPPQRF